MADRSLNYDPLGRLRRVGPDGRILVHAGDQLMAEYVGATLARRHVFAPGLDEPLVTYAGETKTWHVADERGSVVAATDAAGMVVTSWGYGPHGEPDARGMAPAFGFTGALSLPQIGLTSMRARVYSHRLGRFLQPDPIGQAGGINLYDYAGGDPVNGWDPFGLWGCGSRITGHVAAFCYSYIFQNGGKGSGGETKVTDWVWACAGTGEGICGWNYVPMPRVGLAFAFTSGTPALGERPEIGGIAELPPSEKSKRCASTLYRFGKALEQGGEAGTVFGLGAATAGAAIGGVGAGPGLVGAGIGGFASTGGQALQDIAIGRSAEEIFARALFGLAGGQIAAGAVPRGLRTGLGDSLFGIGLSEALEAGLAAVDPEWCN